ncbi:hypothetical protein EV356DRAFT_509980 [Viridothelium virens]|uniref:Early meiotic induction protein 1 n=1 Tax=Viridothelium virens TaxID=1048519 RepID=A0A6A6GW19_VIRVR|nr:hypothetical protein EV356DRAFT_509980 [Viridothelium virens]
MGWWYRADPQTPVLKPSDPTPDPTPTPSEPPASPRELTDKPTRVPPRRGSSSRDDQADPDLQSFLAELERETRASHLPTTPTTSTSSSLTPPPSTPAAAKSASTSASATAPDSDSALDPASTPFDSQYPTTMSCRAAFDTAYWCQSPGGQFLSLYRYGHWRSCSQQWSDFWFCMRTRGLPAAQRAEVVRERYREKEARWRMGPNSEDVWEARTPGESVEGFFARDPDGWREVGGF